MTYASHLQRYSTKPSETIIELEGGTKHCKKDIFQAAVEGDVECIEANLKLGVDLNRMGQPKQIWGPRFEKAGLFYATPLCYACSYGREDAVKLLLKHGARTDIRSACGWTCTEYAKSRNYVSIIALLSEHA